MVKNKSSSNKKMDTSDSESSDCSSDEELREAFAKGSLKPGLNREIVVEKKIFKNNVGMLKQKTLDMKLTIPWIERLDIVNGPAPLAPEFALQIHDQEERRAKQAKGNKKLPQYKPGEDPAVNDFKRELMFHRQAQAAVIDGIARLKKLKIPTKRPDDYFAEMAKSDAHMHKVREHLTKIQLAAQRSEKVRQIRQQRSIGKQMQIEATLQKHSEKRKMLEEVKKYRKGVRKDLDFLDNKKSKPNPMKDQKNDKKQKAKNAKFGFGGKKRGSKKNTRDSAADFTDYRRPGKPGAGKKDGKNSKRVGKNRRTQLKSKRK